ncbi:MAG TPA: hypothetical protein VIY51_24400 [Xanthobacteraceae bacterium]
MKPHDPDLEWIKKILADLERNRNDPQIAALMGAATSPEHPHAVETVAEPLVDATPHPGS